MNHKRRKERGSEDKRKKDGGERGESRAEVVEDEWSNRNGFFSASS